MKLSARDVMALKTPEIIKYNANMPPLLSLLNEGKLDRFNADILRAITDFANAGAEIAAIASNTPHIGFEQPAEASPIPLVRIVTPTRKAAQKCGYTKIGLPTQTGHSESASIRRMLRRFCIVDTSNPGLRSSNLRVN